MNEKHYSPMGMKNVVPIIKYKVLAGTLIFQHDDSKKRDRDLLFQYISPFMHVVK